MTKFEVRTRSAELHIAAARKADDRNIVRSHAGTAHVFACKAWQMSNSIAERATAAELRDAALSILDNLNR